MTDSPSELSLLFLVLLPSFRAVVRAVIVELEEEEEEEELASEEFEFGDLGFSGVSAC